MTGYKKDKLHKWFKSYGNFTEWADFPIGGVVIRSVCAHPGKLAGFILLVLLDLKDIHTLFNGFKPLKKFRRSCFCLYTLDKSHKVKS